MFFFSSNCNTKDITNKNKTKTTYNTTNDTILVLLALKYFLRVQFLHIFYSFFVLFFFDHTPMYPAKYNPVTGFHFSEINGIKIDLKEFKMVQYADGLTPFG